jgi:hypothetical protein
MSKAFLIAAAVLVSGPAFASYDQALETCNKFAADNKTSAEPCACIAKAIGDDPKLLAEEASLKTLEDYDKASEAYRAKVEPCLPPEPPAEQRS